jgi:hypothetical protein
MQTFSRHLSLGSAQVILRVKNLTVKIALFHNVMVYYTNRSKPCRGKVRGRGNSQATCAHYNHHGILELPLTLWPDFGQHKLSAVAFDLGLCETVQHFMECIHDLKCCSTAKSKRTDCHKYKATAKEMRHDSGQVDCTAEGLDWRGLRGQI